MKYRCCYCGCPIMLKYAVKGRNGYMCRQCAKEVDE